MPVREIRLVPDPILKKVCRPADWQLAQELCQDLVDTMRASPGCGLAAPQIGVDLRVFCLDVTPKNPGHGLLVLINPTLIAHEGRLSGREGCLSIHEYTANVTRYAEIVVSGTDPAGKSVVIQSSGFEAICIQHELDHLDGILFLDRVTSLKTDVFRRKGVEPRFALEDLK